MEETNLAIWPGNTHLADWTGKRCVPLVYFLASRALIIDKLIILYAQN
jgi:hypothetical protein